MSLQVRTVILSEGENCGATALVFPGGRYITDFDGKSGTSDLDSVDDARAHG